MAYRINSRPSIDLTPNVSIGVKIPLVRKDGVLFDMSRSTREQALSNLKNLILTRRGERVMYQLFGTTLQDTLFEQNTEVTRNSVITSISEAIQFWLPYITIETASVEEVISQTAAMQEHGFRITLVVSVSNDNANIPITFLITPTAIEIL